MRILIVSPFYPPQAAIASTRVHSHATAWAELGAEVVVLTTVKHEDQRGAPAPSPGVHVEEIAVRASGAVLLARRVAGSRGLRAPLDSKDQARPGRLGRWLAARRARTGVYSGIRMPDVTDAWVAPAVRRGLHLAAEAPFDVVFASSGPYTALRVADALCRAGAGRRFVAEFRDLWTANHSARGSFPFAVRERALERGILERADRLVTVSEGLAGWLRAHSRAPVDVIYNGHGGRRAGIRGQEPDGSINIAYTGAVYERGHDLRPLMKGFAELRRQDPNAYKRLRLVVAGGSEAAFRDAARAAGVEDRLDPRGMVSRDESMSIQDRADALISFEWTGPQGGVLTGKIFEYLAASSPVLVVGPRKEIAELVERCGRGVHAGSDGAQVAQSLSDLVQDRIALAVRPNFETIDSLTRRNQSRKLFELLAAESGVAGAPG